MKRLRVLDQPASSDARTWTYASTTPVRESPNLLTSGSDSSAGDHSSITGRAGWRTSLVPRAKPHARPTGT